ncbi:MAG: hypothetical protein LC790_08715, partial [Actinobacteria bacterium]|nr:hypothetical protein [Actinomycetota bacterium]
QERIVVTAFPQTDVRMVPASLRLYEAVVQQQLTLPDNEELRTHMANTIARHNRRGWRLDTSPASSSRTTASSRSAWPSRR